MADKPSIDWRSRIVGHGRKKADQFLLHPDNPKFHPVAQREALAGAINEVGQVAPVIENKRTGYLLDGHERIWIALDNDAEVDFIQVDVSEDEEQYILATLDPIAHMARHDRKKLDALLHDIQSGEHGVQSLLNTLAVSNGIVPTDNPYDEWVGMPEFEQDDLSEAYAIKVKFKTIEDLRLFADLVQQTVTENTKSIWYPQRQETPHHGKVFIEDE